MSAADERIGALMDERFGLQEQLARVTAERDDLRRRLDETEGLKSEYCEENERLRGVRESLKTRAAWSNLKHVGRSLAFGRVAVQEEERMMPIVEGGKVTRTHRFTQGVPSQDVSRFKARDPHYWLDEPKRSLPTSLELATRGVIRWWMDRAPWWLVLAVTIGMMALVSAAIARVITS